MRYYLQPPTPSDIESYIRQRIKAADYFSEDLFDDEKIAVIADISRGLPRRINNLCGVAL